MHIKETEFLALENKNTCVISRRVFKEHHGRLGSPRMVAVAPRGAASKKWYVTKDIGTGWIRNKAFMTLDTI